MQNLEIEFMVSEVERTLVAQRAARRHDFEALVPLPKQATPGRQGAMLRRPATALVGLLRTRFSRRALAR